MLDKIKGAPSLVHFLRTLIFAFSSMQRLKRSLESDRFLLHSLLINFLCLFCFRYSSKLSTLLTINSNTDSGNILEFFILVPPTLFPVQSFLNYNRLLYHKAFVSGFLSTSNIDFIFNYKSAFPNGCKELSGITGPQLQS